MHPRRILVVDNYDSFTNNLVDLLQRAGADVTVTRNDQPVDLMAFDGCVISPGPGHPANPADVGFSLDILRSGLPVWGVCLGHQLMAVAEGGEVVRTTPVHGTVQAITHDAELLFDGLPNPFSAVRYNSLTIGTVPKSLVVTATAEDGTIMGIRHRTKPWWGVQFHPEAYASEAGLAMARNFLSLVPPRWRVNKHIVEGTLDPVVVARKFFRQGDAQASDGRQSADQQGQNPPYDAPHYAVTQSDTFIWLDGHEEGSVMADASGPHSRIIRGAPDPWQLVAPEVGILSEPSPLGWMGAIDYEAGPRSVLAFVDRAVEIKQDHAIIWELREAHDNSATWGELAAVQLRNLVGERGQLHDLVGGRLRLRLRHSRAEYEALVRRAQEYIRAGESYEICLTTAAEGRAHREASLEDYCVLRAANPSAHGAYLRFGDLQVLSTSPERFVLVKDGRIESKPIKGTRPRGATPQEDAAIATELAENPKDRAENLMIVDLVRHDLATHAVAQSVNVPAACVVESYATVHQLVSVVRATLAPTAQPVEAVRAAFPGGSMTGAPKLRTMAILRELERQPRGIYSGAIGRFSVDGTIDLAMPIRTLVADGANLHYGVGGAVLAVSDPSEEYEEVRTKLRALAPIAEVD